VILDGRPFGKPASRDEARRMLEALRGRAHEVVTGVAVVEADTGRAAAEAVVSRVVMRAYAPAEIEAYLDTPEPYDKAGAYAVQGEGGRLQRWRGAHGRGRPRRDGGPGSCGLRPAGDYGGGEAPAGPGRGDEAAAERRGPPEGDRPGTPGGRISSVVLGRRWPPSGA
jgi:hypothetical protein